MARLLKALSVAAAVAICAGISCSSDSGATGGGGGSGGGDGGAPDFDFETGGPGACNGTAKPADTAYCDGVLDTFDADCQRAKNRPIDVCNVLLTEPGQSASNRYLSRTSDTKDYSGTGDPNLSCFDPASYPPKPGSSRTVKMKGEVTAFANGCDLVGVKVEVYTVQRTGDEATDGDLGDLIGSAIVTDQNSEVVLEDVDNCVDDRKNRAYEYLDVPTETELVVLTSGATTADGWRPLYTYNVFLSDNDPDCSGSVTTSCWDGEDYVRELTALAEDDFNTIPTVAIGRTIQPGNGAIGGEIHDCDNIRIQNAIVDVSATRTALSYFNADEDNPLPDVNRNSIGTGRTAIYSALDVSPGVARVSAVGVVPGTDGNDQLVSLGYYDVRVFPDSVTSVTLRGLRPHQVP